MKTIPLHEKIQYEMFQTRQAVLSLGSFHEIYLCLYITLPCFDELRSHPDAWRVLDERNCQFTFSGWPLYRVVGERHEPYKIHIERVNPAGRSPIVFVAGEFTRFIKEVK